MTLIAPSLLAADFLNLNDEIKKVEEAGVDYLHIDLMDGHFVPNITFGIDIIEQISKATRVALDVHMMVDRPERYIEKIANAGATLISVHAEACTHLHATLSQIKKAGCKAGVVLNPGTPASCLDRVIQDVDLVLQMTVNPGFGGQRFIPSTLDNITYLANLRAQGQGDFLIQVDGGINEETAKLCKQAGADVLVAGSYIFNAPDPKTAVAKLKA